MTRHQLEVTFSIPSVKEHTIKISERSTVATLKRIACKKLKIEPAFTNLLLDGRTLSDGEKLSDLDLSKKIIVDYLWARHLILWGIEEQSRIRDSSVFIAGAGAIGNEVAKNLAMLGVKRIVIADYDVVELSNVSRMFFFEETNLGEPKAEVLARGIAEKYSFVETLAYTGAIEDIPLGTYLESDVIVSGLDNIASRIYLASIARRYLIPMVDGGMSGYQTRVQVYIPPDSPCPMCHLPANQFSDLIGLKNPCDGQIVEEIKVPSLPTSISFVSSVQTQEVLKILLGYKHFLHHKEWPAIAGPPLKGIQISDLKFNRYSRVELKRSANCIVCGGNGIAKDAVKRLEIPFTKAKNSTDKLVELIKKEVGTSINNISLFSTTEPRKIEKGKKLTHYGLKRGGFVSAIFMDKSKDYKEIIVKLD